MCGRENARLERLKVWIEDTAKLPASRPRAAGIFLPLDELLTDVILCLYKEDRGHAFRLIDQLANTIIMSQWKRKVVEQDVGTLSTARSGELFSRTRPLVVHSYDQYEVDLAAPVSQCCRSVPKKLL